MSFHKEIIGKELYLYMNGNLIYKRWLDSGQSKVFDVLAYDKYTLRSINDQVDNKMTFIKTKGGGLQETGAKDIPLNFSHDNLLRLLNELIVDKCNYTHQDFSNWASKYHMFCIAQFDNGNDLGDIEEILCDIDMQWDMNLFNSYSIDQLLSLDLSSIKFPHDWLNKWLTQTQNL